jgi:glutathione peroxidase
MKTLAGQDVDLSKYNGKVILMVNTASKCGYTPQYEGLQALYAKYKDKGLVLLGFPANDFGQQETGEVKWNFEKFLIGKDGKIVNRYLSKVEPMSDEITKAVEAELAK